MCGIIGYIGKNKAAPILLKGLKRLEYRGYDSAGLAVIEKAPASKVFLCKAKGKIRELEAKILSLPAGTIGIAHTRWATHGEPSEENAHPHTDCSGKIFVCHNGIIENYKVLKDALISRGHKFKSDTDTEVLAHIIEENLRYANKKNTKNNRAITRYGGSGKINEKYNKEGIENGIVKAIKQLQGTYGLAILISDFPDRIFIARNASPLVIGIGDGEYIAASDASAIINRTRNVIYMKDEEMAILGRDKIKFLDFTKFSASAQGGSASGGKGEPAFGWKNFPPKAPASRRRRVEAGISLGLKTYRGGRKNWNGILMMRKKAAILTLCLKKFLSSRNQSKTVCEAVL